MLQRSSVNSIVTAKFDKCEKKQTRCFFLEKYPKYHTYSLLRGGFYNASSGFGLWLLQSYTLPTDPLRSFIQSCTLPTDPLRPLLLRVEIFSGYTIHILYYAGVSIMPPRVLASGPKPCGGNKSYYALLYIATSFPGSLLFLAPGARKGCVMVTRSNKAKTAAHTYLK